MLAGLILEEIRRLVADAIEAGSILRPGQHASRLWSTYAGSGMSVGRIVDEMILAATKAGVPVEISRRP